jgi:NOL1/NOP2/fmu family ribosome biogenesis protein
LDVHQSRLFLSKENIVLPENTPKGFVLLTYQGVPLGWVKNLGNRTNNLYPQEYRIRMRWK